MILGDGKLKCEVYGVEGNLVKVECLNDATIEQGLRINAPGKNLGVSGFTPEEKELVLKYKAKADFICIPNVLSADDVKNAREFIGDQTIKLITKMETELGLTKFPEILSASSSVMVSRGDLSKDVPTEKVFLA